MKLSIIIPVYNVAAFLPAAIDSVLAQTFRDFELILVDDGATDGSAGICDDYARRDSRVRVIHQENAGVSAARNAGVAAAQGEYIGFTDSDDIIERDMFAVLMSMAEGHDADVAQCQHDREGSLNNLPRSREAEIMDGPTFVRRLFTCKGGVYTNQVALWSKIYRAELFRGITFPVGRTYEDEQETYKLCLKAKKIVETPDVLYHYIKRENSIITGVSARKMLDKQAALLDRLCYLPPKLPELEEGCARAFISHSSQSLCRMYEAREKKGVKQGIQVLRSVRKRLKPYLSPYDRLYLAILPCAKGWILGHDFAPIQNLLAKIKK